MCGPGDRNRLSESPRPVPPRRVVRRAQIADAYAGRFVLGVDELTAADVDADVRESPRVGILEEHEVSRLQVALGNRHALADLTGCARPDIDPKYVQHDPVTEARAIEARRTVRGPHVWISEILHC